ncbi:hypothetical protein [Aminobacter ciceronei]|uniref:Uncharacterized protein n=1 Tax=Aminobacter ciceronei TaxID=150723 RepID=A0ABR6CH62_9HYPH|nr:hypothetical protein [Aminobacter ciceronei]MBA8910166.1 hypothetical protein [Aminobacter ciceronei]MBA9023938.1 hypothetical protein [Aminobacter ciceronei]
MNPVTETLDYTDIESELHEAVNMSEIACSLIEHAGVQRPGGTLVTDDEWNQLLFAVFHANKLSLALKRRWEEVHESNVKAKGGAA